MGLQSVRDGQMHIGTAVSGRWTDDAVSGRWEDYTQWEMGRCTFALQLVGDGKLMHSGTAVSGRWEGDTQ